MLNRKPDGAWVTVGGEKFDAQIQPFTLAVPNSLN